MFLSCMSLLSLLTLVVLLSVTQTVFSADKFAYKTQEPIDGSVINSKIDKVYHLASQFHEQFRWEKSILSEMAQTQSHVLSEIRDQEYRIRRLNRNLKRTLKFCANQKLLSAKATTTPTPYKVFFSNEIETNP
ncbi:uncharacterized protein LOC132549655 [Ylistrum balloti]|uniref:uncharacterized protein LOC132549655 n=1 Tax=Ylistrum balloti TaxID=509963 RepID=UPI00290581D0|nr:uncharacterized protein LOC132549655 [Ylistrum balloti]